MADLSQRRRAEAERLSSILASIGQHLESAPQAWGVWTDSVRQGAEERLGATSEPDDPLVLKDEEVRAALDVGDELNKVCVGVRGTPAGGPRGWSWSTRPGRRQRGEWAVMNLRAVQNAAWANKLAKGFNVSNVPLEFCLLTAEVSEAFEAWRHQQPVGGELADVVIFAAGLAEMLGIDLGAEVERKLAVNEARQYEHLANGTSVKVGSNDG